MIDFKKLNDPETRERIRKHREEMQAKLEAKEASQKRMIEYLKEAVDNYVICNAWEIEFIQSVYSQMQRPFFALSDKQDEVLTRLFEKY